MTSETPFVPYGITICGLSELDRHADAGVTHVLSILDPGTPDPTAFEDYGRHHRLLLRFHDVIDDSPGMTAPTPEHVERVLAFGREIAGGPVALEHLLVHCHLGLSRSTAAMTLMLAQARPDAPLAALDAVRRARPRAWPNSRMIAHGEAALGLDGALSALLPAHYALVLERFPEMEPLLINAGRGREVALGRAARVG